MFNLKPHGEFFSEAKLIFKNKTGYWKLTENYGNYHYLTFDYWKYTFNNDNIPEMATWKRKICIPLNLHAFYILFVYRHLGKCHKDLRSKFYIGKARENKEIKEKVNE